MIKLVRIENFLPFPNITDCNILHTYLIYAFILKLKSIPSKNTLSYTLEPFQLWLYTQKFIYFFIQGNSRRVIMHLG